MSQLFLKHLNFQHNHNEKMSLLYYLEFKECIHFFFFITLLMRDTFIHNQTRNKTSLLYT